MKSQIVKQYTLHDHYSNVHTFMDGAQQAIRTSPSKPSSKERILRARLILEEALEQIDGLGITVLMEEGNAMYELNIEDVTMEVTHPYDAQAVLDACADIMVINTGTAITCGFSSDCLQESLEAVDKNNLSKLDGPNGPIIREDGKLMKPDNYMSVDNELKAILEGYTNAV